MNQSCTSPNFLSEFIDKHALPLSFVDTANEYYLPVAQSLLKDINTHNHKPLFVSLTGSQGAGKSTIAALFTDYWMQEGLEVCTFSLDDVYLTKTERLTLSEEVHPLLKTRGVPGTHDTRLLKSILEALENNKPIDIPKFDKANDDRDALALFRQVSGVDVVLLEGWCWGALPQEGTDLLEPVNQLERTLDASACWRNYVNTCLLEQYVPLYGKFDFWLYLKAPSFNCVAQWRFEQEAKLAQRISSGKSGKVMNRMQIEEFVAYYQRITEQLFIDMPAKANVVWHLSDKRIPEYLELNLV